MFNVNPETHILLISSPLNDMKSVQKAIMKTWRECGEALRHSQYYPEEVLGRGGL